MKAQPTENVKPELEDVSLRAYLEHDDTEKFGYVPVRIDGKIKQLRIGALLEDEVEKIQRASEKPDKRNRGAINFDSSSFKRLVAVEALHKGDRSVDRSEITAMLGRKLGGDVSAIAEAAIKLSGFDDERLSELDKLVGFSS